MTGYFANVYDLNLICFCIFPICYQERVTTSACHCDCAEPAKGPSAKTLECSADKMVSNASSSDVDPQTSEETRDAQGDTSVKDVLKADTKAATVYPQTSVETKDDVPGDIAAETVSKATSGAAVNPQASFEARDAPGDAAAVEVTSRNVSDASA